MRRDTPATAGLCPLGGAWVEPALVSVALSGDLVPCETSKSLADWMVAPVSALLSVCVSVDPPVSGVASGDGLGGLWEGLWHPKVATPETDEIVAGISYSER